MNLQNEPKSIKHLVKHSIELSFYWMWFCCEWLWLIRCIIYLEMAPIVMLKKRTRIFCINRLKRVQAECGALLQHRRNVKRQQEFDIFITAWNTVDFLCQINKIHTKYLSHCIVLKSKRKKTFNIWYFFYFYVFFLPTKKKAIFYFLNQTIASSFHQQFCRTLISHWKLFKDS